MNIQTAKDRALELKTSLGRLNVVSWELFGKGIDECTEQEFTTIVTEYIANRDKYEPEQLF